MLSTFIVFFNTEALLLYKRKLNTYKIGQIYFWTNFDNTYIALYIQMFTQIQNTTLDKWHFR